MNKWKKFAMEFVFSELGDEDPVELFYALQEYPAGFFNTYEGVFVWQPFENFTPDQVADLVENLAENLATSAEAAERKG
jgi:hypothetical protein